MESPFLLFLDDRSFVAVFGDLRRVCEDSIPLVIYYRTNWFALFNSFTRLGNLIGKKNAVFGIDSGAHACAGARDKCLGSTHADQAPLAYMGLDLGTGSSKSVNSRDTQPPPGDARTVELPLNQFGPDAGTFPNRYWVYSEKYKPGGPVFIYDTGESDAEPGSVFFPSDPRSFFHQIVEEFNGIGIAWEHRMHGKSVPAGFHNDTSLDRFKYLTVEQALADVDAFAKQFSLPYINATLSADHTPWVFIGASYSGGRAAWVRNKYPDSIYTSWAASPTVEGMVDLSSYFDAIWAGMNYYGFGNCSQYIHAAIQYIDHIMDTNLQATAKLKEQFLGVGNGNASNSDFVWTLEDLYNDWQRYGMNGHSFSLRKFCDMLETDPRTNRTAPKDGWAPTKGVKSVVDKWAVYRGNLNAAANAQCANNGTSSNNCSSDDQTVDPNYVSWRWQACTEWGMSQLSPRYS